MHSYAQTNLQLFNQLRHLGYSNTELSCIFNAYQLVMRLFTGQFRASGKTFIAHLVGTASILGRIGAPGKVVAAGLLHAAYASGDFGDEKKGISDAKQQQIRRAVGQEVEEYIARYTTLKWTEKSISAIHNQIDTLAPIDRDVLLIRLANELEEYLDLGILYCGEAKQEKYIKHDCHLMVDMADKLGFPTLAAELSEVLRETAGSEIPVELSNRSGQKSSFLILPISYQKPLLAILYRRLAIKLRRFPSAIVRRLGYLSSATSMRTKIEVKTLSE